MTQLTDAYIYLDYAASAPLCEETSCVLSKYLNGGRANILSGTNANSLSLPGRTAFKDMNEHRRKIAELLNCRSDEIIFTSGATEADNAALIGITKAASQLKEKSIHGSFTPNIITTQIEHDAILSPAKQLQREGIEVRYLKPDRSGKINAEDLESVIDDNTVLVSIQMANSEIGVIQNIEKLANIAHSREALFHTDATQALGKIPVDMRQLNVDSASFSAHKIGGPKGIGALYLKSRTPFLPQMLGGGQENGHRSGTQNVMGIAGFCAAMESALKLQETERLRLQQLRDKLYKAYEAFNCITPTVNVTENSMDYLPNIVSATFHGIESETLILRFDSLGFAVSGGSACSSMSLDPSHVLTSIGIKPDDALCALRVSMGRYTTNEDIDAFIDAIPKVIDW